MRLITQLAPRHAQSLPLLFVLFAPCAAAQWSDDRGVNLIVATNPIGTSRYVSAATDDGGLWVVWSTEINGRYTTRAQRYDSAGYPLFAAEGLLALDSGTNYAEAVDCVVTVDGDLVIAVTSGGARLQRVGPGGNLLWGPTGRATPVFGWEARLVALDDDVVLFGRVTTTNSVSAQRYDRAGAEVWGSWVAVPDISWFQFDVAASASDIYVSVFVPVSGPTPYAVGLQRIDGQGGLPWGPVARLISGGAPAYANNGPPSIHAAGANGVVVGYDILLPFGLTSLYVQRVDPSGAQLWGPYGTPITTVTSVRDVWDIAYDDLSDELVAVWSDREAAFPSSPEPFSYRMQRLDALGTRRFAAEGLELVSFTDNSTTDLVALALGAADPSGTGRTAQVVWKDPISQILEGGHVDSLGSQVSGPIELVDRSESRFNLRVYGARSGQPQGQALWLGRPSFFGPETVRAQNFRADGLLGGPVGLGDVRCEGSVSSTGARAELRAEGSAIAARNHLALLGRELPPNQVFTFLYARDGLTPNPGGAAGNLCLSRPIGRGSVLISNAAGQVAERVDLAQLPAPMGSASVGAGETWHFQGWYRDTQGSSETTSGLRIRFL
ncbi:MAG: hypothetical protein R3F49_17445 [Planctomycetota bacterium]